MSTLAQLMVINDQQIDTIIGKYTSLLGSFERGRADRKEELKNLLGEKQSDEKILSQLGLILNSSIPVRSAKQFSGGDYSHYTPTAPRKPKANLSQGNLINFREDGKVSNELGRQLNQISEDRKNGKLTAEKAKALMGNINKIEKEMHSIARSNHEEELTPDENAHCLQALQENARQIP